MANGWTDKEMIEMILDGQQKIQVQIDGLGTKVDSIMVNGCAHRGDDLRRVVELESAKNKMTGGLVVSLLAAIGALFGLLFGKN